MTKVAIKVVQVNKKGLFVNLLEVLSSKKIVILVKFEIKLQNQINLTRQKKLIFKILKKINVSLNQLPLC